MRSIHRTGALSPTARRTLGAALGALLLAFSAACNSLLTVDNPARVPTEQLDDPALMPILEAAGVQTLQCGLNAFATTGAAFVFVPVILMFGQERVWSLFGPSVSDPSRLKLLGTEPHPMTRDHHPPG